MKKIILSTLIFLGCLLASAQEKVGTYHTSVFKLDYDVIVSKEFVYLNVGGLRKSEEVRLGIKRSEINKFIISLTQAKEKYLEWKKIAEENNVTSMRKEFDIKFPRANVEWYGTRWYISYNCVLKPLFVVTEDGLCSFLFTDRVSDSSNEYIEQFYMLSLREASDFDSLIDVLDPEKAEEALNKKQNIDELFK